MSISDFEKTHKSYILNKCINLLVLKYCIIKNEHNIFSASGRKCERQYHSVITINMKVK